MQQPHTWGKLVMREEIMEDVSSLALILLGIGDSNNILVHLVSGNYLLCWEVMQWFFQVIKISNSRSMENGIQKHMFSSILVLIVSVAKWLMTNHACKKFKSLRLARERATLKRFDVRELWSKRVSIVPSRCLLVGSLAKKGCASRRKQRFDAWRPSCHGMNV